MQLLVNLDVPDLDQGIAFYTRAFEFELLRRLDAAIAELAGGGLRVYLLAKESGSGATTPDRLEWPTVLQAPAATAPGRLE